MRLTFLIDNAAKDEALAHEWGLCVHIAFEGQSILLDTGDSGAFVQNAAKLGVDLATVDFGVLSHAHYDHANGLSAFFAINERAPFYLQKAARENCYDRKGIIPHYIGVRKGTLSKFAGRIRFSEGKCEIAPKVWLLPHSTPNLEEAGKRAHMLLRNGLRFAPDGFAHEQSLVLCSGRGLVVFNSCSHAGADTILSEAAAAFPDEKLYALIGGFHLFDAPDAQIITLAKRLAASPVERVLTGHCTGGHAYKLLKEDLGGRLERFYTGLVVEL